MVLLKFLNFDIELLCILQKLNQPNNPYIIYKYQSSMKYKNDLKSRCSLFKKIIKQNCAQ